MSTSVVGINNRKSLSNMSGTRSRESPRQRQPLNGNDDEDDGTQVVRALSAFDKYEDTGAACPIVPRQARDQSKLEDANIVEKIAYDPAFRTKDSTRPPMSHHRPGPRRSSLNRTKDRGDSGSVLGAFDDFADEGDQCDDPVSPRPRTRSSSTSSRRGSSCHSRQSHPRHSQALSSTTSLHGSSVHASSPLPGLQITGTDNDHGGLTPLAEEDLDPSSFDLVAPADKQAHLYDLEHQSELLFSHRHLAIIFNNPLLLQRFTNFLHAWRPDSVPLMVYYLNALKGLKALSYTNALAEHLQKIDAHEFTSTKPPIIDGRELREKAQKAFETLANYDLPAFITQTYVQTVSLTIKRRIADTLPPELREQSEGLAEVFCLTDPSRKDNPIVFASQQFHETTRYGMNNVIGRNCRFLQGPKTNPLSVKRIREKLDAGQDHCETFLNYRRDGQPFMNLLMVAPLIDSRGAVRYHIGAQVDVSGLVKSHAGLESFSHLIEADEASEGISAPHEISQQQEEDDFMNPMDKLQSLVEMFTLPELKTVREHGGAIHRIQQEDVRSFEPARNWNNPRVLVRDDATVHRRDSDPTIDISSHVPASGRLVGVYQHYLLVRPYPNLRVLFASPSLRVPGMLQSPFMDRIGGSSSVRETIQQAFADGTGVTAKIRWMTRIDGASGRGRPRWIHCTPLLGQNKAVGVWMIIVTDDDRGSE